MWICISHHRCTRPCDFRASLEADLKAICDGEKSKEEVLAAQIAVYRQIFTLSMASAKKLDAATRHFLEVRILY